MAQKHTKAKRSTKSRSFSGKGLAAKLAAVEATIPKKELAPFQPGDTVKVHVRIKEGEKERVQIFEGAVINKSGRGTKKAFTVRKISHGTGVERVFLETSPKVAKVEVVQHGKVRRAKLYYLRDLEGRAAKIERRIVKKKKKPAASAAASK